MSSSDSFANALTVLTLDIASSEIYPSSARAVWVYFEIFFIKVPYIMAAIIIGQMPPSVTRVSLVDLAKRIIKVTMMNMSDLINIDIFDDKPS